MKQSLIKLVVKELREKADLIEANNSTLSESEAVDIMEVLCHISMSKAQACEYLNTSPSNLGNLIRTKKIPKGKKVVGFKELRFYRDELDNAVKKIRENKSVSSNNKQK